MKMNILWNIKNILKNKFVFAIFAIVLCLSATSVAQAKTINNTVSFPNSIYLEYFKNFYNSSGYKNYILVMDDNSSMYYDLYFCLTDDELIIDNNNVNATCNAMYRYYSSTSGYNSSYIFEKIDDDELIVNNSIFFTSNNVDTSYLTNLALLSLNIGVFSIFLIYVLFKLFRQ